MTSVIILLVLLDSTSSYKVDTNGLEGQRLL